MLPPGPHRHLLSALGARCLAPCHSQAGWGSEPSNSQPSREPRAFEKMARATGLQVGRDVAERKQAGCGLKAMGLSRHSGAARRGSISGVLVGFLVSNTGPCLRGPSCSHGARISFHCIPNLMFLFF